MTINLSERLMTLIDLNERNHAMLEPLIPQSAVVRNMGTMRAVLEDLRAIALADEKKAREVAQNIAKLAC